MPQLARENGKSELGKRPDANVTGPLYFLRLQVHGTSAGGDADELRLLSTSDTFINLRAYGGSLDFVSTKVGDVFLRSTRIRTPGDFIGTAFVYLEIAPYRPRNQILVHVRLIFLCVWFSLRRDIYLSKRSLYKSQENEDIQQHMAKAGVIVSASDIKNEFSFLL